MISIGKKKETIEPVLMRVDEIIIFYFQTSKLSASNLPIVKKRRLLIAQTPSSG